MDVNISPAGAQSLRLEGNVVDRLDVEGQSFEMFLNISETLGSPIVDPGHQSVERHRSVSDDRRDPEDEAYALDRKEESSRDREVARGSADEREDENASRDPAEEMAQLIGHSHSRRENRRKGEQRDTTTRRVKDTSDDASDASQSVRSETEKAGPPKEVDSGSKASDGATPVRQDLGVQMQPDIETVDLKSAGDDLGSVKTNQLKTLTQASKAWTQPASPSSASDEAAFENLKEQEIIEPSIMEDAMDVDHQDWQLLQSKSQEAKKGSGTTAHRSGQNDPLIETLSEFSPDDSRFADEPVSDTIDSQLNDLNGEVDVVPKQQTLHQQDGEAEWSRLLREGAMTGHGADKSNSGKSELGTLAGLGKVSSTAGAAGPKTGLGGAAPIQVPTKAPIVSETKQAAVPTRASLPEGVDELSILRQVSDGLRLKSGRTQKAEIRLNPQELGTVQIKMEMSGDRVKMVVSAEHAGVGDLLNNGLDQLKKDLLAQGLHVEEVEIRNELTDQRDQKGQSNGGRDDEHDSERQDASDGPVTRHHTGRLNVRA